MEVTEEDRKKKLAAGREKLAAFRKKRARRRTQWDGGEGDRAGAAETESQQSNDGPEGSTSANFCAANDSSSATAESDQFSLTSGDEWSAEELELHSSVYYQTKLSAATQRIAELEETLEGKQLALDRMVMEMQSTAPTIANENGEDRSCSERGFELKGSMLELKEALMQRDRIICQLTSHLQWRNAAEGDSASFDAPNYLQETQRLSEEVSVLQQQLCQAGETLRNQEAACQASVQALQEAKEQILSLRVKITEKNDLLKQLSQNLTEQSADLLTLKSHESELLTLVKELQQQAVREAEARQMMSDTAQADANRVCLLEQELEELTNQQEETAKEFAEVREQLRNAEIVCAVLHKEKGEGLARIVYLETELDRLVEDKERAFARLSDLEEKMQGHSAIIQTSQDCDLEYGDASERVMELEREISDLSRNHSMYADHLNQRNAELEMLLGENLVPSSSDMSDLKNKINSQQNDILALTSQLQAAETENAFHKVQVTELQEQLEKLHKEYAEEQEKHEATRNRFEKEMHILQTENSEYKMKLSSLENEIMNLKQELTASTSAVQGTVPANSDVLESEHKKLDGSQFADSTSKHLALLQESYSNLETQFAALLQQNSHLQSDLSDYQSLKRMHGQQESTIRDLLSQVDHLQDVVEDSALQVQEKNYQVENLHSQLTAALKEKEELGQQISQQSEIVEKQTYNADTRVRKLESRISSLGSELTDFKEALKESETANIELQDKYDAVRRELETVNNQFAVSESRAAQLKNEWDMERDQLLKLKRKAGELEQISEDKTGSLGAAEDAEKQHQQVVEALEAQYTDILQQNRSVLPEMDQLIISHSLEVARLEENLEQKAKELENLLLEKNQIASELAVMSDIKAEIEQQLTMKSQELAQTELANKSFSQQLSQAEEERVLEHTRFTKQLEQKTQEVLMLTVEKEKLARDKESSETELNVQLQDLKQQLEQKAKELPSVTAEKKNVIQESARLQQQQETEVQTVQVSLDKQPQELLQTASAKESIACSQEFVCSELSNQLLVVQRQLEEKVREFSNDITSAEDVAIYPSALVSEAGKEAHIVQAKLQDGAEEMQILMAENERLVELLNSEQSASARSQHLQTLLKHREAEFAILLSEWKAMEAQQQSTESALARSLKAAHQTMKEKEALLEHQKISSQDLAASAERQDETADKLHHELGRAAEQLAIPQQSSHDFLQSQQQEVKALESKVNQLALELSSAEEERDSKMASLADQAERFRAKEEEIVAENNLLNHQLEAVKIEAQKMAEQNKAEQESVRLEMEGIKSQMCAKDLELQALAEEMCHQKNLCELQSGSVVALKREKEDLELRLLELEKEAAEMQNDYHTQCQALQTDINELKLEREERDGKFEQEKQQLVENCILLKEQLESTTSELERLQKALNDRTKELESVKMDLESMQHQKNTLQHDFAAELEDMHAKMATKEEEIVALSIQLKDFTEQLKQQKVAAEEEAAAAHAELEQKNVAIASLQEELGATGLQLEQTREDKEMLKSNFDYCMEEMTQKASEQEDTIKQLQSRLAERSDIVNRDHGQLREIYETQLSDLEHRLAIAAEEIQRLENAAVAIESEKMKLQEGYTNQITELEVSLQSTELEQLRLKEQMNKMVEVHEKEIVDLKHSFEIQLATVEENCQTLEKALGKQDTLMVEVALKFEQEKAEREKNFELQLSELYELSRMHETEVGRVKRQMDEMRKDHLKEKQDLQQCLDTQIFELENKCSIATCELDRMRSSLWTMEGDFSTEKNALEQKISELEDLCLSQEKQVLELQHELQRLNVQSEESNSSLVESHRSEIFHLEEANSHMAEEIKQLQEQLKTVREMHRQEMEAVKHQQAEEVSILQERCRQMETHSQILQSHLASLSPQPASIEVSSSICEEDRLQIELSTLEGNISVFQEALTQKEQELSQLQSQISTLTSDIDRRDVEIRNLTWEMENGKAKYKELQILCSNLEHKNEQLTFGMEQNSESCKERRHFSLPEKEILMAVHKKRALSTTPQLQRFNRLQHKDGNHGNSEGFEPELDPIECLDLATVNRNSLDYFVEETDTCTAGGRGGRPRVRSVPGAVFEGFEPDVHSISFSSEYNGKVLISKVSKAIAQKEATAEAASSTGCFEPEEESIQAQSEDCHSRGTEEKEGTFAEDSFQPESLPDTPTITYPCFAPCDQGFLPLCPEPLPASPIVVKKQTKMKDAFVQTENVSGDSCRVFASGICNNLANGIESDLNVDKKTEEEQTHLVSAFQAAELVENAAKETEVLEFSRRLEAIRSDLEDKWVQKMRSQEVKLLHQYDVERIEYQKQLEQQCHQQVEAAKHENYVAFVNAVRQMKKHFDRKTKFLKTAAEFQGRKLDKELREDGVESPLSTVGQAEEESLVEQLHKENQELAEVRDVLLQQIAISRTQGLRKTMQQELQTVVSECSKHLPSLSLKSVSNTDEEPVAASDVAHAVPGVAGRHQGRVVEKIASILQRGETKQQMAAVFQELLTLSQQSGSTGSEASKTMLNSNDGAPTCEGESEASSAQERFLEELEEMSQQSGQDLPLEWELTSATVTPTGTTIGDFDHDQMGTGSVWEVFDGRCLRQDCLELESLKQKHEAEMASLHQQLEEHRQHSEDIGLQLQEQYLQAVSSLRDGLAQAQQQELDAVVGQLQELHQRQLQQLVAQHKHDMELEVMAVRVAVEQIQTARVRLIEEEHNKHLQRIKKENKDQLNALRAEADRLRAGEGAIPPLSACEELTRQYQQLIQKINQSLEKQVLTHVREDRGPNEEGKRVEGEENPSPDDVITAQQAKALQATLQAQQEEVLHLRSKLLAEYDHLLQERSAEAMQQSNDVLRLQEEMAALQQQYEQQIKEFQAHLNKKSELKEMQEPDEQENDPDMEQVKATYEQRITDMEDSFTRQIVALEQTALHIPDDAIEALTSKLAAYSSMENESPLPSQRLVFVKDYVHRSTFVDGTSNVDTDTTASSWGMYDHEGCRLQDLIKTMEEKNLQIEELERSLDRERQRAKDFVEELGSSSQQLSKLAVELEEQKQAVQNMMVLLEEKDRQLQETKHKAAESEKLLRELTDKEDSFQKEGHVEGLHGMLESDMADSGLVASPSSVEEEVRRMKAALEQATAALRAVEQRERRLQEQLEEFEHQHQEAVEALRQEMEHEAQVERDSLQSEFQVQLEVEMRRQAAELQRQFVEKTARTMGITSESCPATCGGEALEEEGAVGRTAVETSIPPHIETGEAVQEMVVVQEVCLTLQTSHNANSGKTFEKLPSSGTQAEEIQADVSQNFVGANMDSMKEELKSDFDKQVEQLQHAHEAEKTHLAKTHLEEIARLQNQLLDAEEKYNRLKEVIEEREGAGVDQLLKDRYDMELELAKSLMQKEFDETLAAEKKKFVGRHRQLMDGFMSEQEAEAEKIKQQHQQNLNDLRSCLAVKYVAIIGDLQAVLKEQRQALPASEDDAVQVPSEKEQAKSQEEEKEMDLKDAEDPREGNESGDVVVQEMHRLHQDLKELCHLVAKLTTKHHKVVTDLMLEHEARLSELKAEHQDQLEAAALDTEVLKSELDLAHADLESLRQKLASQMATQIPRPDQLENEKMLTSAPATLEESSREAMQSVSEISFSLLPQLESASHSSKDGDETSDVRSSLEYEETDEECSTHSFSSVLGKTRSFENEVGILSPSHTEQRIKQLKAEIEQLTHQLEQQQISVHTPSTVTASPPPAETAATLGLRRGSRESESLIAMLQSDLDRISAERDTIQQINNRLLQLLSDSIHTYVEVEDRINHRLHNIVSLSSARPQSPSLLPRDGRANLAAPSGAGVAASSTVMSGATGIMSSPRSDHSWQPGEADTSLTLEETSILSIATDEGLDMSQRLADSIFTGPDIGAEGEEIVADARGRLQSAVGHLLDMIGQTTQQLMEAKTTQADLLESLAGRSSDNKILAARIQDLEEQLRQEVSAKEYFSLELHKAEGLIKGYSSERETMEDELQLLEEQKEALARDLETTRSQLQDFQDAAGELEARRQDVERHQILLQENAGQEAQESSMAGGDANKSEEQALLAEVNTVKQERREQTLQLRHRLEQAQQCLHDREANLEELERALQRQREEMREQVEDLRLQLENAERQLKSNKQFLDDQMNERELEREEFQREIETLKQQLQDKDRQEGSHVFLHHEIQDLTEQMQTRMEREAVMHQRMQELQQTLQDRDLSAQDLRVWIAALEKELDQRGDMEQQLKDRIHKLEQQLTQDNDDTQSVGSSSPVATYRPDSPGSANLSLRQPTVQSALSYVSLEEELKKAQQAKEELAHQKEALKHTVQEQLLQISALRNQLDDLRHWRGPPDPSASASTTADLREELESERETVQKKEEEITQLKSTQENLEKQLAVKQSKLEMMTEQLQNLQHTCVTSDHMVKLEKERDSLKARVGELSAAHAFPPELLEEKNAEIDELRHQLGKQEVRLKEKDELISDLQDTVLSLQRGETCLDVSLPFNEPVSLNASFTERPPAVVERPACLTTLAQELDQTASEQGGQIADLNSQVDRLHQEVTQLKDQLQENLARQTALETELHQKDDDLSQLQEEKAQKQEALVEKESRLEQLMVQIRSLQTEINNLTAFQIELQKDYDTVQNMLEEKEQEIESLTREYLEARSQPDGSDVADSLKEELNTLMARLDEKEAELQKEKKLLADVQKELKEVRQAERDQEQNTDHLQTAVARTLEEQVSELKAEVLRLEESVKEKEQVIRHLEEEKSSVAAEHEMELATIKNHLIATQDEMATKVSQLEILLAHKENSLQQAKSLKDKELHAKEQEAAALHEALEKTTETVKRLEGDVLLLQQHLTTRDSSIRDLQERSQQLQDHMKKEMAHLEEQLHHLSSTTKTAATDEVKGLQNELSQASDRIADLQQQLINAQSRLEQALTQVEEKEDHIQQLQEEKHSLQLGAPQPQAEDREQRLSADSLSHLPESSEDTEVHDERLRDFLAKAEQMQMTVRESLSASLPMSSDTSRLSRWDSEPGLSSTCPTQLVTLTFGTETWMRRQQRELASKNRELALLREELEGWLQRKGRSHETFGSASTVLQLYEKESVIISLKRELVEAKALLAAAEKRAAESSESFVSVELSPQTKQQIAHLRSELRLAKAALAALQEHSHTDGMSTSVDSEVQHVEQRGLNNCDAETQLHRSSAAMSATDFVKKVQELREEMTVEHQKHIRDIQEAACQDMEMRMTELQARHDHEVQQLHSRHEQQLEQALAHQQQALEKQHKTELNSLRVQHQQEIERLRSEELASLTEASVTRSLRVGVGDTQQVEHGLIGSFATRSDDGSHDDLSTVETNSVVSGSEEVLPSRLQALLNRLRQAGDNILSISELNFLLQHLAPQGEASSQTLVEAFGSEKSSLVKTVHALKELLSQADRVGCGLQETEGDWRSELLHALVEVYKHERLCLESELYGLRLLHPSMATADIIKNFDNRLREQEQLHQSGLDAMLRAERQSLLAELDDLRSRLLHQRTEQQEQQARLSNALAKMEEQASSKEWKLQREVQVLEYKLQQEKVVQEDLQKRLEAERQRMTESSAELSRSKAALASLQSELQTTQIQLSRSRDALEREQHRFTSVTDALEEERQKNNRLAEMLETLRRQHHNLEAERDRAEAIYKERERTENKVIKELRAELASHREQLRKTTESAEKEHQDRQQALTAASEAQQANLALRQEVDKVQHQTKKVLEGEATKLQELQSMLKQEQNLVAELQESLDDRDSIIARLTRELGQLDDLQLQVQHLQKTVASTEQHLEMERKQVSHLTSLMNKDQEEYNAALQQEHGLAKQLRSELSALKAETGDVRHQLELEKARAEGLHLDLERAQSELRAMTQHAGVTERHLEAEQTATWNKLRAVQHTKDELQIKVHQLELELERMQDKVQDLELELDRSRQRELEARHDIERHKLYPVVSPRVMPADGQAEAYDTQLQARLGAFLRQLQDIGERLHVLLIRQHNRNSASCSTSGITEETSGNNDGSTVESLLQDLQALQDKMFGRDQLDGGDSKQMVELDQLKSWITVLTREKEELQHRLNLLENEDNLRTSRTSHTDTTTTTSSNSCRQQQQRPAMPQYVSDAPSDDEFIYERTTWASERLSLQMALDSAEHEIDRLKKELRRFRGRFDSEGFMVEADRDKMQRLYGKYLRAESFRKALVYQKKYLLLLLGGYQDSEQETLAIIATMGGQPSSTLHLAYRRHHHRLYTIFRSAARTVIAIFRMKYLVRKWKRATRVGSPVVSGRLNQHYGYVATTGSFTQPNFTDHGSHYSTPSATSLYVHTVTRGSPNGNAMSLPSHSAMSRFVGDGGGAGNPTGVRFSTPPTKEFAHTRRPSNSPLSTNARRHLLSVIDTPQHQSNGASEGSEGCIGAVGGESVQTFDGVGDDFLQRLENLQTRLSSQNGPTVKRPVWR